MAKLFHKAMRPQTTFNKSVSTICGRRARSLLGLSFPPSIVGRNSSVSERYDSGIIRRASSPNLGIRSRAYLPRLLVVLLPYGSAVTDAQPYQRRPKHGWFSKTLFWNSVNHLFAISLHLQILGLRSGQFLTTHPSVLPSPPRAPLRVQRVSYLLIFSYLSLLLLTFPYFFLLFLTFQ